MNWLRRVLIELWAMVVLATIIGFLGPFGSYNDADFLPRCGYWLMQLMGAYVLVRPSILLWATIADATSLPRRQLVFWGVLLSSFPLALLWTWSSSAFFRGLSGFTVILPFAVLSALGVLAVVGWARSFEQKMLRFVAGGDLGPRSFSEGEEVAAGPPVDEGAGDIPLEEDAIPRLAKRLSPGFNGRILALQSEDHYVRVHGAKGSELLFMRLRDAIAEMGDVPGEQVHRSWWIAAGGVASVETDGRKRTIRLHNGSSAPIARDSVSRLERSGFLQGQP